MPAGLIVARMNSASRCSSAGSFNLKQDLPLNIVLVYEDHATGIDAMRSLNRLARQTGRTVELGTQNVWKFELLASPALRNIAAREAANADMVIIAAHGPETLPIGVMHWTELWLARRGTSPAALVALLDGTEDDALKPTPMETCLKRCARRGRMDFFAHKVGERLDVEDCASPLPAARSEEASAALQNILQSLRGSGPRIARRQHAFGTPLATDSPGRSPLARSGVLELR